MAARISLAAQQSSRRMSHYSTRCRSSRGGAGQPHGDPLILLSSASARPIPPSASALARKQSVPTAECRGRLKGAVVLSEVADVQVERADADKPADDVVHCRRNPILTYRPSRPVTVVVHGAHKVVFNFRVSDSSIHV